jgi:hypothetical protein
MPFTMPNMNKNMKGFIKKIKGKGFFLSLLAFLIITGVLLAALFYPNFSVSNENARYLLSALAQSQAAIIAVVITLTLIAVQLASQTYSPRVMDLFLKSWAFHLLLFIYSTAIMYDLTILSKIPSVSADNAPKIVFVFGRTVNFDFLVVIGLALMVVALSALFWFIKVVMERLKPENIINNLCGIIKPEEIEDYITKGRDIEKDPLIPIKDVINKAIAMHDEVTIIAGIRGLESLFRRTNELIFDKYHHYGNNNTESHRYGEILCPFKEDLTAIGISCGDKKLNLAITFVTRSLGGMGEIIASGGKPTGDVATDFAYDLKIIDEKIGEMILNAKAIHKIASHELIELMDSAIFSLEEIGVSASKQKLRFTTENVIDLLREIGNESCERGQEFLGYLDISEGYQNEGPERLQAVISALDSINLAIINVLPDLTLEENAAKIVIGRQRGIKLGTEEGDMLIELAECTSVLESFAKTALQNRWKERTRITTDSIMSLNNEARAKDYDTISYPVNLIEKTTTAIANIVTSSDEDVSYYLTKNEVLFWLECITKELARKKSGGVSYAVNALISIYDFIFKSYCSGGPVTMTLEAPSVLGEIAGITVANGKLHNTTEKIADALKTIGINACKSFTGGSHNEWWEDISKDSVKCLIFSGTISIQCDNEKFAIKLAEKLRDMNKVYNENGFEDFIDRIFEENEREKTFGFEETFTGGGELKSKERKMTDDEFKAFKQFKKHYKEDVTI